MNEITDRALTKEERICGKKRIENIFKSGESFVSYPLRIVYSEREKSGGCSVSMMVSVPKKKIKKAVKRNRIKRLIREAYRLNKGKYIQLSEEQGRGLDVVFIYLKDGSTGFKEIEDAILKAGNLFKMRMDRPDK